MNSVQLIGYIGNELELRYTQGGTPVVTFSVATKAGWTDKDGERQTRTDWHKVTVFGSAAEHHKKHLDKGSRVGITGELRADSWKADDGTNRKSVYVVANRIDYLSAVNSDTPGDEAPAGDPDDAEGRVFTDDDIPF